VYDGVFLGGRGGGSLFPAWPSSRSMREVLRPRFGGEGDGEGFEGVRMTGWRSGAERGASSSDWFEWLSSPGTALRRVWEVVPPARDSKAAIRDWRAAGMRERRERSAAVSQSNPLLMELYAVAGMSSSPPTSLFTVYIPPRLLPYPYRDRRLVRSRRNCGMPACP
jgi:hypothetical protein